MTNHQPPAATSRHQPATATRQLPRYATFGPPSPCPAPALCPPPPIRPKGLSAPCWCRSHLTDTCVTLAFSGGVTTAHRILRLGAACPRGCGVPFGAREDRPGGGLRGAPAGAGPHRGPPLRSGAADGRVGPHQLQSREGAAGVRAVASSVPLGRGQGRCGAVPGASQGLGGVPHCPVPRHALEQNKCKGTPSAPAPGSTARAMARLRDGRPPE